MLYPKIRQKSCMFKVNKGPILSVGWQERWDNFRLKELSIWRIFSIYSWCPAQSSSLIYYFFPASILKLWFFSPLELKTPIVYSALGHPDTDLFITTYYLVFLILWILVIVLMPVTFWFDLCNEQLSLQSKVQKRQEVSEEKYTSSTCYLFSLQKKNLLEHFVLLITQ